MPPRILWSPREILVGRTFRLPVESESGGLSLDPGPFRLIEASPPRQNVVRYFLTAPDQPCVGRLTVRDASGQATAEVRVSTLAQLRSVRQVGAHLFPRRWPLGEPFQRAKSRPTLTEEAEAAPLSPEAQERARWVLGLSDRAAWAQLPPSELPSIYTVNETQGCPQHGKAIYAFDGFYPWRMSHRPCDFLSQCPVGGERYPSNRLMEGDHLSGPYPDDGFGYIDEQGHRFFYAAAYHWRQVGAFWGHVQVLTRLLAQPDTPPEQRQPIARRLGLLLARQAVEELYLAAVPQFRHGSHLSALHAGLWGPPDTAAMDPFPRDFDPANGTVDYCIHMPFVAEAMARGYDLAFPYLREDRELVQALQALGLDVRRPEDLLQLIEEMLACFVQADIDGYARCNQPATSMGTLHCLRVLDPHDVTGIMDYLYDCSSDQLRAFVSNGFYPDGVTFEASGGYNAGHAVGAYQVDHHIEALRRQRPGAVPEDRYPPLSADPKFERMADPFFLTLMCGTTYAGYGDDHAPGTWHSEVVPPVLTKPLHHACGWASPEPILRPAFRHRPTLPLARALAANGLAESEPLAREMIARHGAEMSWPSLLLDPSGIAILRTRPENTDKPAEAAGDAPPWADDRPTGLDRAAVFVHYLAPSSHRHDDFMHVSFVAHDRPWSFDLGYPSTHETGFYWEARWAAHNRGHIVDGDDRNVLGRGRCLAFLDTHFATAIDLEGVEGQVVQGQLWGPLDRHHRRLLVLLPTVGEGVALIDLYRLRGGREHWRTFLGSQTDVEWRGASTLQERPGTAAGPDIPRKEIYRVPWSDACLTLIDQIRQGDGSGGWSATAVCRDDPAWRMDVHGLAVSPRTQVMLGRACNPLTDPEDSPYRFEPIFLRRLVGPQEASTFDMVFEPYHKEPAIRRIERLAPVGESAPTEALGVRLELADGSAVTVLWNPAYPESPLPPRLASADLHPGAAEVVRFEGGFELQGPLGVWREADAGSGEPTRAAVPVGGSVSRDGRHYAAQHGRAVGRIVEVDHAARTALVEPVGDEPFTPGSRVRILPRGHWYQVEQVEPAENGRVRLRFDLTGVLSTAPVAGKSEGEIELGARLPLACAGYFRKCCLQPRGGSAFVPLLDVRLSADQTRGFAQIDAAAWPALVRAVEVGRWADLVDYWPGCEVVAQGFEVRPEAVS